MTATIRSSFRPTKTRVLTAALFVAVLFGCYGLLSAQQARSATTLSKHVWGGIRQNGTIAHQKHITAVSHPNTGFYFVTFDRHVDNCAIEVTARDEGGTAALFNQFAVFPGSSTKQVLVNEVISDGSAFFDGDFDIFGMCPSS